MEAAMWVQGRLKTRRRAWQGARDDIHDEIKEALVSLCTSFKDTVGLVQVYK